MDEIRIHDLETRCIVGIHPHERVEPQVLIVNATLYIDTHQAACTGRIGRTVHYAEVAEQIIGLLSFRRYRLLEVAATEVVSMLLGVHGRLQRVKLEVKKPAALLGIAKAASLTIERDRSLLDHAYDDTKADIVETRTPEVEVVHLWHSPEACLTLQTVSPGAVLSVQHPATQTSFRPRMSDTSHPATFRESAGVGSELRQFVWVMSGQLQANEHTVRTGQSQQRDSVSGSWSNTGSHSARLFCCTTWCENLGT